MPGDFRHTARQKGVFAARDTAAASAQQTPNPLLTRPLPMLLQRGSTSYWHRNKLPTSGQGWRRSPTTRKCSKFLVSPAIGVSNTAALKQLKG